MTLTVEGPVMADQMFADSVTEIDDLGAGKVVVCGSHAGRYVALCAAARGVGAIILNDAGVGLDEAGVAALPLLDRAGIAAAAVSHQSARIGDAGDTLERGRLSHVNDLARSAGCVVEMSAPDAVDLLRARRAGEPGQALEEPGESSCWLAGPPQEVWALDSVSLVGPQHARAVVMTGSHGGLLGGRAETALKFDTLGAVFNDAGGGIDGAGFGRLDALDARAIPAATVDAMSARIGDGRSTYFDGVVSAVNATASGRGAEPGMAARDFADLIHKRGLGDGFDGC